MAAVDPKTWMPSVVPEYHYINRVRIYLIQQVIRKLLKIGPAQSAGVEVMASRISLN